MSDPSALLSSTNNLLRSIKRQGEPFGLIEAPPERQRLLYANRTKTEGLWYWRNGDENVPVQRHTVRGMLQDVYAHLKESRDYDDKWKVCVQLDVAERGVITIEAGLGVTAGRCILAAFAEAGGRLLEAPISIEAEAADDDDEALLLQIYCEDPVVANSDKWPPKGAGPKTYLKWLARVREKLGWDPEETRRANVYGTSR